MQQWLVLCLRDLGCEWAAASRAYAPVAALAVRPSAEEEEEGDSVRRQGFFSGLRLASDRAFGHAAAHTQARHKDRDAEIGWPKSVRRNTFPIFPDSVKLM